MRVVFALLLLLITVVGDWCDCCLCCLYLGCVSGYHLGCGLLRFGGLFVVHCLGFVCVGMNGCLLFGDWFALYVGLILPLLVGYL